ncbi:DUF4314 domain-containing protein [Novipirellula rosea]|uniref:DUF4314 domain-containing protein n=1 Tax=Novipirellula rosea TaxID=1031540 RepID=A0ABP8M9C0_9BACT|tara:strand:- start:1636 stop:2070 length:435 start_codon:yes stop_codon:yes gene_type:complete
MKTFYVATLARYVLVDAADESEAASLGQNALYALYADLRAKHGRDIPIEIRTVRLATDDEIDLWQFHQRVLGEETVSRLKMGDRIRLIRMADDPDPIPVGQRGTVVGIHPHGDWTQVDVDWDNGRSLMLSIPHDEIEIETEANR